MSILVRYFDTPFYKRVELYDKDRIRFIKKFAPCCKVKLIKWEMSIICVISSEGRRIHINCFCSFALRENFQHLLSCFGFIFVIKEDIRSWDTHRIELLFVDSEALCMVERRMIGAYRNVGIALMHPCIEWRCARLAQSFKAQ